MRVVLARGGSVAHRANTELLLWGGRSLDAVGRGPFIEYNTVRTWYQQY